MSDCSISRAKASCTTLPRSAPKSAACSPTRRPPEFAETLPAPVAATAPGRHVRARQGALSRLRRVSGKEHDRGDRRLFRRSAEAQRAACASSSTPTGRCSTNASPLTTASAACMAKRCNASLKPEDHRGGLLTQAAILSLTSDGTRHRPVHRGVWVLESIIGKPPPPPPANVPALNTPADAPKTTVREKLEQHRADPNCTACHRKIDPLGLAFDNYDAIGRWRTVETVRDGTGDDPKLDPSGELPDGRKFADAAGLKKPPARRHRQIRRRLHRKARHLRPAPRHDLLRPRRTETRRRAIEGRRLHACLADRSRSSPVPFF